MDIIPRKRLFGRSFRRRANRRSFDCPTAFGHDGQELRFSHVRGTRDPSAGSNFHVPDRTGHVEGDSSVSATSRRHGAPRLQVTSSPDDDIHDDPNDPLVASICNLLRAPSTSPPATSHHVQHSYGQDHRFVERDFSARDAIQRDPTREAAAEMPVVDQSDDPRVVPPSPRMAVVRSEHGKTTFGRSQRHLGGSFLSQELEICFDKARSVRAPLLQQPLPQHAREEADRSPRGKRAVYIPDTITHTPEERYQPRSERAARVAVALEKLAGSFPASSHDDTAILNLADNLQDLPLTPTAVSSENGDISSNAAADSIAKRELESHEVSPSQPRHMSSPSSPREFHSPSWHRKHTRNHLVDPIRFPLRDDVIPLVIESMAQHRTDPCVVDRALTTLRRLTTRDAARDRIGASGGVEAVVDVMRLHSLRVRIQTQACLVLANLTYRNIGNKERVLRARGFQAVVASMSLHRKIEHIQAWGCLALRNFSNSQFSTSEDTILVAGAVDVLLSALDICTESNVVQNQAPVALGNIATSSSVGLHRIRETGGIESILSACHRNMSNAALTDGIMSCIRALIVDERNQRELGYHGGVEIITECMRLYHGHLGITVKGCAAFRYLSFLRENRERLGACGGIHAIVAAMGCANRANEDIIEHILKALGNSTYDSYTNKTLAGSAGGITATLNLISTPLYRESPRVAEDGCRVLRNLADGVLANHELIMKHRGLATVLDVVRIHGPSHEGVAEHGIALFVNLATNKSIAYQLRHGSGDLISAARHMSAIHASSENVNRQVSNLMHLLDLSESWGHSSPSLKLNRGQDNGPELRRFGSGPARAGATGRSGLFASAGSDSLSRRMRLFRFGSGDIRRRENMSFLRHS